METPRLEILLYNAIISLYDNSLEEYKGIDDEDFINMVCKSTGMTRTEYENLMSEKRE